MITPEKKIERREHKRFLIQEGAYALLKNNSSKLGQIKNVSEEQMHKSFKVDIFISGQGFCLKNIPSKKISDFHIDNKLPFSTFAVRQVGIQFNELNHSQLSQLDNLIRDHTNFSPLKILSQ